MKGLELTTRFENLARSMSFGLEGHPFRMAILPGEVLRVPRSQRMLRVLSGTAWVSLDGEDQFLGRGQCLDLEGLRHDALVSDIQGEGLFLEVS